MFSPAQPLSFDCQKNDLGFCQVLKQDELPVYQFSKYCDRELLGTLIPLECEKLITIQNLSDVFTDISYFAVSDVMITPTPAASITHFVRAFDYFQEEKSYLISLQIVNLTNGYYTVQVGDSTSSNLQNGVHSFILNSGTTKNFVINGVDGDLPLDGYVANVTVQCIRYSELFNLNGNYEFINPLAIRKTAGTALEITKDVSELIAGKTYKLSFRITENTCNAEGTLMSICLGCNLLSGNVQLRNGFYELDIIAQSFNQLLQITLPSCMDGIIQDITLYEKNEIRMGVFDRDKNEAEGTIEITLSGNKYLATLNDIPEGCIRLGYADLCSDYWGQFTGRNIIDLAQARELINIEPGGGEFEGSYVFHVGTTAYVIYRNVLKRGIQFELDVLGLIPGENANIFDIQAIAGGMPMILTNPHTPPFLADTAYHFIFQGISGEDNEDLILIISAGDTNSSIGLIGLDVTILNVDQAFDQFIPELFSECLNVQANIDECNFVELIWSNDLPVFGLDFNVEGYSEAKMWLPITLWHPKYAKEREIFESATGRRIINYSDTTQTYLLTTDYIPEYLLTCLQFAVDCNVFKINGQEYVCTTESIEPEWNKFFTLSYVELDMVKQDRRYLKTYS